MRLSPGTRSSLVPPRAQQPLEHVATDLDARARSGTRLQIMSAAADASTFVVCVFDSVDAFTASNRIKARQQHVDQKKRGVTMRCRLSRCNVDARAARVRLAAHKLECECERVCFHARIRQRSTRAPTGAAVWTRCARSMLFPRALDPLPCLHPARTGSRNHLLLATLPTPRLLCFSTTCAQQSLYRRRTYLGGELLSGGVTQRGAARWEAEVHGNGARICMPRGITTPTMSPPRVFSYTVYPPISRVRARCN